MPLYIVVLWLYHIQKFIFFFIKFQSNVHTFFDASFWDPFFEFLVRLGAKKVDFGSPLAPSWGPNRAQNLPKGAQNRPSGAKMAPKNFDGTPPLRFFFGFILNVLNPQNYYV